MKSDTFVSYVRGHSEPMNYATYLDPNSPAWAQRHADHVIAIDDARFDAEARKGELPSRPWSELRESMK